MSSCSNAQSTKVGFAKNETTVLSTRNPEGAWISGEDREEEEEEDEDADFNPFLKDTPSQEASSSLSSEVDGLDGDVVSSGLSVSVNIAELDSKEQICAGGGIEHGDEEIIMQSTSIPNESCGQELKKNATCISLKRKSALISQSEIETNGEKDSGLSSKTESNDVRIGELSNSAKSQGPIIEIDNEDAICMRTRARYSLASFSLDELETFLQETDDDDDFQNVDDEEEYRKFLAAVLHGGDGDSLSAHENENVDDEDEDNDADFEIELEELLESDVDENASVKTRKEHDGAGAGRRPETRQNKRQKASTQYEKRSLGHAKRPLRPLLPSLPNGPLAPGKTLMPEASLSFQSSVSGSGLVNGFTPQQIGQLHSLIHEHVQLLIQVFSLSILDPSRQHIASQVQGLLFEMLHKRDEVLALKSVPYPSICFSPPYIGSLVSDGNAKVPPTNCSIESSSMCDVQRAFLPQSNVGPSDGRCEYISNRQSSFQEIEGSSWFPFVRGPLLSILDVSPISLVGRYVEDVHSAVQESRKRYLESACDTRVEKEPLFPCFPSVPESSSEVSSVVSKAVNTSPTSPNQPQPKKTLAAMLVESTKKQSIALVPKEIAKLAQRFLPLFNPALFPHKPPLPAVVSRVLFTDSEDVLLALGLMEYNTDWKAIQQRFLPCKSKHQIFVRQKNRCSSKAPENPIKAVRRMKTSPLTKEEVACIQEGLKVYKFDWMSVWKFIVPYRDPSLLPRQWRIALGTQKSYKQDASKKEKRRLYEAKRRKLKSAASESWHAISDKEDCQTEIAGEEIDVAENCADNSGIAYVHQGFLADWRPDICTPNCTGRIPSNSVEENHVNDAMPQEQISYGVCGKAQSQNKSTLSSVSQHLHTSFNSGSSWHCAPSGMEPRNPVFNMPTTTSKYYYRPYRSRRVNSTHLVKLAPDLPPVNLPPSVRIVSQTAFEGHQCKTSKIYPAGSGVATGRKDNCASHEKFGIVHSVKGARMQDSVAGSQLETGRPGTVRGRSVVAENGTSTDLQMHPLLFQAPEDGSLAYYPLKFSSGSSSSFSFFSGTQPQLNLSLFHSPPPHNSVHCPVRSLRSNNSASRSGGIDFHPLLQKSNDTQFQTGFDTIQTESLVNDGVVANGSSSIEKSNDLDLEIHLSSASGREKSMKSKELKAHGPMASTKAVAICGTSTKPQEINAAPSSLLGGKNLTGNSSKLDSCAHSLVVSNDNISSCDVDDIGDQSHPEIVMEQEELSDSEEDIEENVEFECEEMADSEGEDGSGCEQILEGQNKEISTSLGKVPTHTAGKENPCEPRVNSDPQIDDSLPSNNTSTCKIAPTSERNDDKSNSSWLSLDSGTADDPLHLKTKNDRATIGEVPTSENVALSRPSRCNKKTKSCSKGVTGERHTMDTVQQLSLGPLAFAAPRKPRKRTGKSNASSNIGLTHDNNHNDG